jgi:lambda repressor-like predicted transcriptional regulator
MTPENAYDFGYLLADGFVQKGQSLGIQLAAKDRGVLEGMRERFRSDAPVRSSVKTVLYKGEPREYQMVSIHFSSVRLCSDLLALGLGPGKDFQDYEIADVYGEAASLVIRGFFDGDGTAVRVLTRNPHGAKIVFNNRRNTLEWAQKIIGREAGVVGTIRPVRPVRNNFSLDFIAHRDVARLTEWMYSVSGPYLARKRDKLDALVRERDQSLQAEERRLADLDQKLGDLYRDGKEFSEISAEHGIAPGIVHRRISRLGLHHRKAYLKSDLTALNLVQGMSQRGMSIKEIAVETGFSTATARKLAFDAAFAAKLRARTALEQEVHALRENGMLVRDLAIKFGHSKNTIAAILKKERTEAEAP